MTSPSTRRTALVVIARDEAPRIARLLDSVAPWVDQMLVLDTGSRDDTPAIARQRGAQVAHFDWCDDFAVARNAALVAAAADWHLVLDADEWLVEGGPALSALRQQAPEFVGAVLLEDLGAAAGAARQWLSRMLPGGVRYAGRIHEQPQHRLPLQRLPLRVAHDGYDAAGLARKRGRNRPLLRQALATAPGDAYLWFHLGKDCAAYDEHAGAAAAFARAETLREPGCPWRYELAARHLYALKRLGRHAEGLQFAEPRLGDCADSPDFHFALGDLLLDWAACEPARHLELLPMAQAAWQRCLEIGERPDQPGSVAGRGSHLAAHNLAVLAQGLASVKETSLCHFA
ncbi:MAG: glycosyltransferase [Burkholderiales bacterium]|nr:glycosyltransferase [Burkholderiales bacterium]